MKRKMSIEKIPKNIYGTNYGGIEMEQREMGLRIAELRSEANETQQQLADSLGVKRETVKFWESGERQIKGGDIARLARHFNVTADYLLGLSSSKSMEPDIWSACTYTGLSDEAVRTLSKMNHHPDMGGDPNILFAIDVLLRGMDGFSDSDGYTAKGDALLTIADFFEFRPLSEGDISDKLYTKANMDPKRFAKITSNALEGQIAEELMQELRYLRELYYRGK